MPDYIEHPTSLGNALGRDDIGSLNTLGIFLLAAGIWQSRREDAELLLPVEDTDPLGLAGWRVKSWEPVDEVNVDAWAPQAPDFNDAIWRAYNSRSSVDLAMAVLAGLNHPNDLIRACAFRSAVEMFRSRIQQVIRALRDGFSPANEDAYTIASMATTLNRQTPALIPVRQAPSIPAPTVSCLSLVHGTNFPPGEPVWSVPVTGPLFVHIQGFRSDIYSSSDHFRWEGGYSDYARKVAAYNFNDWVQRRGLQGLDAVAHSHGCNVLLAATYLGVKFDRAVFLSCPVHWQKYQPLSASIARAQSIRVRMDSVILADRGGQRFPAGTIPERVLPIWFDHSATYDPGVWTHRKLDPYIA